MSRIKRTKNNANNSVGIIGKIKIGELTTNKYGKSYPTAIDYFRFASNTASYVKLAEEQFGKTNELLVTFLSDNDNNNCCQRMELRTAAGRLIGYTDLETIWQSKPEGFEKVDDAIVKKHGIEIIMNTWAQRATTDRYKAEWYECLYLRVVLMEYPIIGQWEIFTKASKSSIDAIINAYDTTKNLAGRVRGIPFTLTVKKVSSNRDLGVDANNRPNSRTYPVLALNPNLSPRAQEEVLRLGENLRGLVTTSKIEEAKNPQLSAPTKVEFTEYEDVSEL